MLRAPSWIALSLGLALACSSSSSSSPAPGSNPGAVAPPNPGENGVSKGTPKDPTTQLVIGIDAEDFAAQSYSLSLVEVTANVEGAVAAHEMVHAEAGPLFPHALHLLAPKDKPDAPVTITVIAREIAAGQPFDIVTRTATTRFVPGKTVLAYLFLETRCSPFFLGGGGPPPGPSCQNAGETCIAGKCMADALGDLPPYAADWATNPPSACGGSGAPQLELGKGQADFTALADGETLAPECGPQGGHHLWVALRMKNVRQFGTKTVLSATQPGGTATVPSTGFAYVWAPGGGGTCDLAGLRFQLDAGVAKIADFLGKPLDITATTDDKTVHVSTVRHITVASAPVGAFCR